MGNLEREILSKEIDEAIREELETNPNIGLCGLSSELLVKIDKLQKLGNEEE